MEGKRILGTRTALYCCANSKEGANSSTDCGQDGHHSNGGAEGLGFLCSSCFFGPTLHALISYGSSDTHMPRKHQFSSTPKRNYQLLDVIQSLVSLKSILFFEQTRAYNIRFWNRGCIQSIWHPLPVRCKIHKLVKMLKRTLMSWMAWKIVFCFTTDA